MSIAPKLRNCFIHVVQGKKTEKGAIITNVKNERVDVTTNPTGINIKEMFLTTLNQIN